MSAKASLLGLCLLLMASGSFAVEDQMKVPGAYLPEGDAAAGRDAFLEMRCYACHLVARDQELPHEQPNWPVPKLAFDTSQRSRESIAEAIMNPSHTIAEGFGEGTPEDIQKSKMADFTSTMTVRQMIDIATYLKSPKESAEQDAIRTE